MARLNKVLQGKPDETMLKAVQGFFHENREHLIPGAINAIPVSPSVSALYESRLGRSANVESDGRQVLNKLEIQRGFYNPSNREPVLPGSGIKGAIRTALLDAVNNGRRTVRGERNRDLQQRLFNYTMRDLHQDPMRLVQFGDAAWQSPMNLNGAEIRFAVNRKKHPVEDQGTLVQSQAEQQGLYQLLECVPALRLRAFEGSLSILDVSSVGASSKLPDPGLQFGFAEIALACNRFYRPILNAELKLMQTRGFSDDKWRKAIDTLLSGDVAARLEHNRAFFLRVGRHSGAESVTLNGARSIKIMKGRGEQPEYLPESKTLWLAADELHDQRHLLPFGWLLVEMVSGVDQAPSWPEADIVSQSAISSVADWKQDVDTRRESLAEQQAHEQERRRIQIEEQQRIQKQQEDAERQKQDKLAAELAGLPEDAAQLVKLAQKERWQVDNNALLAGVERYLKDHEDISPTAVGKLHEILEKSWPGIMKNPDATKGKKAKPKYKDRPRGLAKQLLGLG